MPWVRLADESYPPKGATAAETYLNQEAIFRIARMAGVEADPSRLRFPQRKSRLSPPPVRHTIWSSLVRRPKVIQLMGSKAEAREIGRCSAACPLCPVWTAPV